MCALCTFPGHLSLPWSWRSVDVPCALEIGVFLHSDEVRCKLPHILAVVNDAHHWVTAREEIPVQRKLRVEKTFSEMQHINPLELYIYTIHKEMSDVSIHTHSTDTNSSFCAQRMMRTDCPQHKRLEKQRNYLDGFRAANRRCRSYDQIFQLSYNNLPGKHNEAAFAQNAMISVLSLLETERVYVWQEEKAIDISNSHLRFPVLEKGSMHSSLERIRCENSFFSGSRKP